MCVWRGLGGGEQGRFHLAGTKLWRLGVRLKHGDFLLWAKEDFLHFEGRVSHDQICALETDQLGMFIFNTLIFKVKMEVSPLWKNDTKHEDTEQRPTHLADLLTSMVLMSDRSPGQFPMLVKWEYCHLIRRAVIRTKWDAKGHCTICPHWAKVKH